jgi:hypothetical protein
MCEYTSTIPYKKFAARLIPSGGTPVAKHTSRENIFRQNFGPQYGLKQINSTAVYFSGESVLLVTINQIDKTLQ